MAHRPGLLLILVFVVAGSAFCQTGVGRSSTKNPATTINGILRRISDDNVVIQKDDKITVTVALGITTKYYKASGSMMKAADLRPGDRLNIEATQDVKGAWHANNVNQVKVGTPAERAAASQPVESSPNPGRPNAGRNTTKTVAAPPDPNDPGPPELKRGIPRRTANSSSSDSQSIASNDAPAASRPSIHADEVNGVTRIPDAPRVDTSAGASSLSAAGGAIFPRSGDPVIDQAREAAFSFSATLPNFVVKQFTTRYETFAAHGGQTNWHAIDNVTADVVSEDGRESYKNILVNGKPPKEAVDQSGSWSTGEYSSVLLDVLSPSTRADFHNKRSTTIANRAAYLYDFAVQQRNSHWQVESSTGTYQPEYVGAIWIDKENSRMLRVELSSRNMPRTFPLDTVECAIDYDYVPIGDGKFLLPVHSEILSCERGTRSCSRNVIDFRDYKKFSADTSVTFDAPADK